MPDPQTLEQMAARFAPTDISADLSKLSDAERRVIAKLVEASKIVDGLFLRQVWAGNDAMLADLAGQADLVLVDAPCSGSGTWRRNPETRWRITPAWCDWNRSLRRSSGGAM